jgi:hypothetical protein
LGKEPMLVFGAKTNASRPVLSSHHKTKIPCSIRISLKIQHGKPIMHN